MLRLSKNFVISEFIVSNVAKRRDISNMPNAEQTRNLQLLVKYILQPLREKLNCSIRVNSGFRSEDLNRAIGGAHKYITNECGEKIYIPTSQHCKGQASDIKIVIDGTMKNELIWDAVLELDLPFCQMINEFDWSWIHISYDKDNPKRQLLEAYRNENGRTKYRKPIEYDIL